MRNGRWKMLAVLAIGAALGYLAAAGKLNPFSDAATRVQPRETVAARPAEPDTCAPGCCNSPDTTQLKLLAAHNQKVAKKEQDTGKKPNILIIWGDDIGWFNPSCYHGGVMGYQTPNIDRIAKEGARF